MKAKNIKKRKKLIITGNGYSKVNKEIKERLIKKYGKRYTCMNCETIGCIFKKK